MTGCPQSGQFPSNVMNGFRRIFSAVMVSFVYMAGDLNRFWIDCVSEQITEMTKCIDLNQPTILRWAAERRGRRKTARVRGGHRAAAQTLDAQRH
jgi:hypothetical protein